MSEVKRYHRDDDEFERYDECVFAVNAEDFDRVTAERDAAVGREAALREERNDLALQAERLKADNKNYDLLLSRSGIHRDALQQRLTEADERADSFDRLYTSSLDERDQLQQRADVLEGLLRDLYLSDSLSVRQMQRVHEVFNPSAAALKPAQVSNEKPETIAGHDLACRAVNDYRPGECSHNCKPEAQPKGVPVAVMYADGSVLTKAECGIAFETCCKVETPLYVEQPAPVAAVLDERDEFVSWVRQEWPQAPLSNVRDLLPKDDPRYGEYCDEALQRAWVGWQARAAVIAKS